MIALPYVYWLTHKETGEFYIGYRAINNVHADEDLGGDYKSSSKLVELLGFENFDRRIVAEFHTGKEAYIHEQRLIKEHFDDPLCLNKHYIDVDSGKGHFRHYVPHSEEAKRKMSESRKGIPSPLRGKTHTESAKKKQRESHIGKRHSDATRAKMSNSRKGIAKSDSHKQKISESNKGKVLSEEHKQKLRIPLSEEHKQSLVKAQKLVKKLECPHCGKACKPGLAKRWHFDNCKEKK